MCKAVEAAEPRVVSLADIKNADLDVSRKEFFFRVPFEDRVLPHLKDSRDLPMVHLAFNFYCLVPPAALGVFAAFRYSVPYAHLIGLAYVLFLNLVFAERCVLLTHYWTHRKVFRNELLDWLAPNVMFCFWFPLIPPGGYEVHHVRMHHNQNNQNAWKLGGDSTSTNWLKRDSPLSFLKYYCRFWVVSYPEIVLYALRIRRFKEVAITSASIVVTFAIYWAVSSFELAAARWVFPMNAVVLSVALALGNYGQHALVDPKRHTENVGLAYNLIDTPTNKITFNDGYHLLHHENARRHWSELPKYWHENLRTYKENKSLTFRGLCFADIALYVLFGRFEKLASYYVHIPGDLCGLPKDEPPTIAEVATRLKTLVQLIPE